MLIDLYVLITRVPASAKSTLVSRTPFAPVTANPPPTDLEDASLSWRRKGREQR